MKFEISHKYTLDTAVPTTMEFIREQGNRSENREDKNSGISGEDNRRCRIRENYAPLITTRPRWMDSSEGLSHLRRHRNYAGKARRKRILSV